MSDTSQAQGWWIASDGKWYPPRSHPNYRPEPPVAGLSLQSRTGRLSARPEIQSKDQFMYHARMIGS